MIPARAAGILLPLFSTRSADDFGRGDISGLRPAGTLAQAMGHRLIMLLPIDETPPGDASPYSAASVFAIDPSYVAAVRLRGVNPAAIASARQIAIDSGGNLQALRASKEDLLDRAFTAFTREATPSERDAFANFAATERHWLDDYALFRCFKRKFNNQVWTAWPSALSRRDPDALAEAIPACADELERYRFYQFVAHTQWAAARDALRQLGIYLGGDLGFSPALDSAEVWARQAMFDLSRTVGAPPDAFSKTGQRWDLPMPAWTRMRANGFSFLRARVRHARSLFDFLRIDHVVGLFRTYGFPLGPDTAGDFDPPDEVAQIAQGAELLRLIMREAGTMQIVAEDLGLIPPFVRATLDALGLPGYKVARWERAWDAPGQPYIDPMAYPAVSLITTGTHDTDTLAEWWDSLEPAERCRFIGDLRLGDTGEAGRGVSDFELDFALLDKILAALYRSPAGLAIIPIQDLFGWKDRVNVPGTVDAANWRWRLPFEPARIADDPQISERVAHLQALAISTGRW